MTSYCTVSSFCFNHVVVGQQYAGHESQRAEALSQTVRLDVTVVIFAGPNVASVTLDHVGDHVVNESMFVPKFFGFEFWFVNCVIKFLEDVFESAIVFLEDCVFCGKKVFHAEKMEYDGKIFHAGCHAKWSAEQKATGKGAWGSVYDKPADVQPAYYRTADNSGSARMETGDQYKGANDQ